MGELTERLRDSSWKKQKHGIPYVELEVWHNTCRDAADEIERLRVANRLLHDATIILRNGMGGHNHWDHTMKHGAGCKVCIRQRHARNEATKLVDEAADAKEPPHAQT